MKNKIFFIIYCFLLIYTCIIVYKKTIRKIYESYDEKFTLINKILICFMAFLFIYYLYLNNFIYNNKFIYLKYVTLLLFFSYIPVIWGIFISTFLIKKKNQDQVTNILIQVILSILFCYFGFKYVDFTVYTILISICIAIGIGLITYVSYIKK